MNSIEVFSGIGGLGLGLFEAGFNSLLSVELDNKCFNTVSMNRNGKYSGFSQSYRNKNIQDCSFENYLGEVDLVAGGPPCQPFSLGGNHRGRNDSRDMFPEMVRVIREVLPRAFVVENVKGLTRSKFSEYLEYIKLQLSLPQIERKQGQSWLMHKKQLERSFSSDKTIGTSYNILLNTVNAADYGVPQCRERVFFVGFRNDINANWCFPKPTHSKDRLLLSKHCGDYYERHNIRRIKTKISATKLRKIGSLSDTENLKPWVTIRDAFRDLRAPSTSDVQFSNHEYKPGARSYAGHTGSYIDEPSKTIKAGSHGVPGGENMIRNVNGSVRYFTIREAARIQTFPDDYIFTGSWGDSMRQLGNAVPVKLSQIIGSSIRESLERS